MSAETPATRAVSAANLSMAILVFFRDVGKRVLLRAFAVTWCVARCVGMWWSWCGTGWGVSVLSWGGFWSDINPNGCSVGLVFYDPFSTAVPFWGQITQNFSSSHRKRDCSPKRLNLLFRFVAVLSPFFYKIIMKYVSREVRLITSYS